MLESVEVFRHANLFSCLITIHCFQQIFFSFIYLFIYFKLGILISGLQELQHVLLTPG